jgi:hypothetical protein
MFSYVPCDAAILNSNSSQYSSLNRMAIIIIIITTTITTNDSNKTEINILPKRRIKHNRRRTS